MLRLVLFAGWAFPSRADTTRDTNQAVEPDELLVWQLGGVRQEEIRAELSARGVASQPEESVMQALLWTGDEAQTIKTIQHASRGASLWEFGLKRPQRGNCFWTWRGD